MKRLTSICTAALLVAASLAPATSQAQPVEVLDTGFDSLAALSDWALINRSMPPGSTWFQGNAGIFRSQSGALDSYAAANFLSAADGMGVVDNWLITPTLSLTGLTQLSFFTNRASDSFDDLLEVRFAAGSGLEASDFSTLLATIGGDTPFPAQWTQWTASLAVEGEGRFAFRYLGDAATLDYIGLDTVSVITAVPEPATWLMLAGGLGALAASRRLRRSRPSRPAAEAAR